MRGLFYAAVGAATLAAGPTWGQSMPGTMSANVTIATDYVFRGYTQTSEEMAIQGGLDWDSGYGFYVGTWASNLNYGAGDPAHIELDVYAGYAGNFTDNFSYDVGFLYYIYPGETEALGYNFWEVYGSVGYEMGDLGLSAGIAYTPDNFGNADDAVYFSAGIGYTLTEYFSVDANIGYWSVDPSYSDDYADWNIGGTFTLPDWFDVDIRYFDTDASGCANLCDSRFVASISRSF